MCSKMFQVDNMGRFLRCIRSHQRRGSTRRLSSRAIAKEIGLSHTHVLRLRAEAAARGWLVPDGGGCGYRRIAVEECLPGRRWVPLTTCSWTEPIDWKRTDGDGEYLPVERLSLRPRSEIWMVAFASWEPVDTDYPPRLGPGVIAFVRPLQDPSDARVGDWCLVSLHSQVRSAFRVPQAFQAGGVSGEEGPRYFLTEADEVAVIESVYIPCTREQIVPLRLRTAARGPR